MFLHLGRDIVVNTKDIIGIFDLDTSTLEKNTKDFLASAQKKDKIVNVSENLPKSFVVYKKNEKEKIFISQLSSATLVKRCFLNKL